MALTDANGNPLLTDAIGNPLPAEPTKVPFDPWNSWTVQAGWDVVGELPEENVPAAVTSADTDGANGINPAGTLQD